MVQSGGREARVREMKASAFPSGMASSKEPDGLEAI